VTCKESLCENFVKVKALLDHGVSVYGVEHNDGYTPFHRACWGAEDRHAETVQAFLDAGVPPNHPAGNGVTCEKMTRNEKTKEILKAASAKDEL
jgi:ankyrin repeat protein